ncbi:MAG: protein-L-isoaspartate(D-aspartate) O-methyltransferase [Spirochaetales bacterium]|nr:protein-L-isoaspartate(D-aspartate) O-methyltransferase [Spirochaetales bacterium]
MVKRVFPVIIFILVISPFAFCQGGADSTIMQRTEMVKTQIEARGVSDPDVLLAMREVRRDHFVSGEYCSLAYEDRPLPIGYGQTISQPYIVALMTELLDVDPGEKILEIGTGSGYQAAVLSHLTDQVYTIEIIEELALAAGIRFKEYGYEKIKWKNGDGYYGWEGESFDGIIVTAAAGHVPPPLIQQLNPGGRIVIPVGSIFQVQYLMLIIKDAEGALSSIPVIPVRFVPFTGDAMEK